MNKMKSSIRSEILKTLIGFIVGFCVVVSFKAYNTVVKTIDEVWVEFDCPYDIKKEYISSMALTTLRTKLVKLGLDDDKNIIMQYLKNKQLEYFNEISRRIPKDDALIDGLWFNYKYEPKAENFKVGLSPEEFKEVENIINNLHRKQSKSTEFELITKYNTTSYIIEHFVTSDFLNQLNRSDSKAIEELVKFVCNIPKQFRTNNSTGENKISYFLAKISCLRVLKSQYDTYRFMTCSSNILKAISQNIHEVDEHIRAEDLEKFNVYAPNTVARYKKFKNNYNKWLTENCGSEIE